MTKRYAIASVATVIAILASSAFFAFFGEADDVFATIPDFWPN